MRRYTVRMPATSITAAGVLIIVTAPATMVLEVLRAWVGKTADATSEMIATQIQRASDAGTGGVAAQVEKHEVGDPAAAFTALSAATAFTVQPTLTGNPWWDEPWNALNGFLWVPASDKDRIIIPPSGRVVLRVSVLPATRTVHGGLTVMEIG